MIKLPRDVSVALDLLRVLAGQAVLIGHMISFFKIHLKDSESQPIFIQNIGVVVFFILSGFLITYTIISRMNNPDYTFKYFFTDRFSRIYSGFLPAILFVAVADQLYIHLYGARYQYFDAFNLKTLVANLLMLQDYPLLENLLPITSFGSGRPFWTLAIEWWIYMFFGFVVLKFGRARHFTLKDYLIACFFAVVPIFNLTSGRGNGLTMVWLLGAGIFLLLRGSVLGNLNTTRSFILSVVFLTGAAFRLDIVNYRVYDMLFACILACGLLFLLNGLKKSDVFKNGRFNYYVKRLADFSFTLYLIHYTLIEFFLIYQGKYPLWILLFICFMICNGISFLLAYCFEMKHKTFNNWLKIKFER